MTASRLAGGASAAIAALLLAGSSVATGSAISQKVVAKVTASSSSQLYVLHRGSGTLNTLRIGDSVYLGDIVAAGPGATATLKLSVPGGVSPASDLFAVYRQPSGKRPAASAVVKQYGVRADAAKTHPTLTLRCTATSIFLTLNPSAAPTRVVFIGNGDGVQNGPTAPSVFTTTRAWHVVQVWTYHWNDGKGSAPGTIGIKDLTTGKAYGPWRASGQPGSGGVANANWVASVSFDLPAGRYQFLDSNPSTWSQNAETGREGMAWIMATST